MPFFKRHSGCTMLSNMTGDGAHQASILILLPATDLGIGVFRGICPRVPPLAGSDVSRGALATYDDFTRVLIMLLHEYAVTIARSLIRSFIPESEKLAALARSTLLSGLGSAAFAKSSSEEWRLSRSRPKQAPEKSAAERSSVPRRKNGTRIRTSSRNRVAAHIR